MRLVGLHPISPISAFPHYPTTPTMALRTCLHTTFARLYPSQVALTLKEQLSYRLGLLIRSSWVCSYASSIYRGSCRDGQTHHSLSPGVLALQETLGGLLDGDVVKEPLVAVSAVLHAGAAAAAIAVSLDELVVTSGQGGLLAEGRGGSAVVVVVVGGHCAQLSDERCGGVSGLPDRWWSCGFVW